MSRARALVLLAILGAVACGIGLGYLAYTADSFPSQERSFGDYANVVYSSFNGTEIAYRVQWKSASYVPLFVQLNSPATDAANTPVCDLRLQGVEQGQILFLPFTITPAKASLSNVDLSIAVQSSTNSTQFTIVFNTPMIGATSDPISPSDITCQQSAGY